MIYIRSLIRSRNRLLFTGTWVHSRLFGGVRVSHRFSFCVLSYYVSLRSEFRVVMSFTIFAYKCSVRLYLQLFVGWPMSYLRYLCLWCPTHTVLWLCFDCLRLVYPMLPVSLNCPFLIVPAVFSNVYLQNTTQKTNNSAIQLMCSRWINSSATQLMCSRWINSSATQRMCSRWINSSATQLMCSRWINSFCSTRSVWRVTFVKNPMINHYRGYEDVWNIRSHLRHWNWVSMMVTVKLSMW